MDAKVISIYKTKKTAHVHAEQNNTFLALDELAEVACHLPVLPAASTLSKRSFSIPGRTIEERRTQQSSDSG